MLVLLVALGVLVAGVFAWKRCQEAERELLRRYEMLRLAEQMEGRPARRVSCQVVPIKKVSPAARQTPRGLNGEEASDETEV